MLKQSGEFLGVNQLDHSINEKISETHLNSLKEKDKENIDNSVYYYDIILF